METNKEVANIKTAIERPEIDITEIHQAHAQTISASNAWKIMGDLESPALPASARAYIESMVRGGINLDVKTPAMQWGIDTETKAIKALEEHLNTSISFTGEAQKRFYYGDFVSALPDGIINNNDINVVVEIKCLDTKNHDSALKFINSSEELKLLEWEKYCQVQTQLLCTGYEYAVFVCYDPRHSTPLHTVIIDRDQEWQDAFQVRVDQAHAYYLALKAEDDSKPAFTESAIPSPEINNLPRVQIEISEEADEQAQIKAEADKQAANKAHRQRINADIVAKLSALGISDDQSKDIVKAAAKRYLGALVINY